MKLIKIIKNNFQLCIILFVICVFGTIGIALALSVGNFNSIGIDTSVTDVKANITYNGDTGALINNEGNLLPISDNLIIGPSVTDSRVLKVNFNVTGAADNPTNSIYDIVLRDIDIDCALTTTDLKWRLYKGDELISEGNLAPTFDAMAGNRLVLTNTQQDLTTDTDTYTFLLWISESCDGNITECDLSLVQNKYLNKQLSGVIKVELATGSKKNLIRNTDNEVSCNYTEVEIPVCNSLTYSGAEQILISEGSNYKLVNNKGTEIGTYAVTAILDYGYKWSDGTTDNKVIYCDIY